MKTVKFGGTSQIDNGSKIFWIISQHSESCLVLLWQQYLLSLTEKWFIKVWSPETHITWSTNHFFLVWCERNFSEQGEDSIRDSICHSCILYLLSFLSILNFRPKIRCDKIKQQCREFTYTWYVLKWGIANIVVYFCISLISIPKVILIWPSVG